MTEEQKIESVDNPVDKLIAFMEEGNQEGAVALLDEMNSDEQRYALSRMSTAEQAKFVEMLGAEAAADLIENMPESMATSILEDITPEAAADIVEELPDDLGADLIREMNDAESEALLANLDDTEEAADLRERATYEWDTAGGLMTESFAAFHEESTVAEVLESLRDNSEEYEDMDVQYLYVVNESDRLRGVLPLRELVLKARNKTTGNIMIPDPVSVKLGDDFDALSRIFDDKGYLGLPVVDDDGKLKGVVTRHAFHEASTDHQTEDYLHTSGIVGGEELRSMPMLSRSARRLAWLAPNIVLNLIAASIIAMYEDTLQAVIALAVFLPIISDMSGCSGNQAVAVSIRELTLGFIRPNEFLRIVWKEGILGVMNGAILGLILGTIAALWKDNIYLGFVVGGALLLNTILSVLLGGMVPLLLKKFKVDPALASGPILTTCTDMCGFFLVLNIASSMLSKLA